MSLFICFSFCETYCTLSALGLQCVKVELKLCTGVALRLVFARIMERVRFTQRLSELYVQTVAVLLLVIYNKLKQSYA